MPFPAPLPGGNGNGHGGPSPGGAKATRQAQLREKVERDCLKLIQALQEMKQEGAEQSLRTIAARTGMSKDEVNRYLTPTVRELYDFERLLHVRKRNRPLYNWLIVSGPPKVIDGRWAGIMANTSKFGLFQAVCLKFGFSARHMGQRGHIVDVVYHGIEEVSRERLGKIWSRQEAVLAIDEYLPPAAPDVGGPPGEGS